MVLSPGLIARERFWRDDQGFECYVSDMYAAGTGYLARAGSVNTMGKTGGNGLRIDRFHPVVRPGCGLGIKVRT